jgi:hypothetical protein
VGIVLIALFVVGIFVITLFEVPPKCGNTTLPVC